MDSGVAYGLWPLLVVNTVLFAVFPAVFFHPHTGRDWPVMGACRHRGKVRTQLETGPAAPTSPPTPTPGSAPPRRCRGP
jgi:hypothetical protein